MKLEVINFKEDQVGIWEDLKGVREGGGDITIISKDNRSAF